MVRKKRGEKYEIRRIQELGWKPGKLVENLFYWYCYNKINIEEKTANLTLKMGVSLAGGGSHNCWQRIPLTMEAGNFWGETVKNTERTGRKELGRRMNSTKKGEGAIRFCEKGKEWEMKGVKMILNAT